MPFFVGSEKKANVLRTPYQEGAEEVLWQLMGRPMPEYPTQGVAPMSEAEQMAQGLVKEYAGTAPEGMDVLRQATTASSDLMARPETQALIQTILQQGQQETNRMGRKIQLAGAGRSSTGADVLGRSVEDTQRMVLSTLMPYMLDYEQSVEGRRLGAATTLANLGETSMLNRINALSTTGALPRTLEQLSKDADYARKMQQINFPQQQAALAGQILNAQLPIAVTGGEPSDFSQISGGLGGVIGGILKMFAG